MSDPLDLTKLEEVAGAYDTARGDNGHCGEGTFEARQRRSELAFTATAFAATFDSPTVLRLIQRVRELEAEREDIVQFLDQKDAPRNDGDAPLSLVGRIAAEIEEWAEAAMAMDRAAKEWQARAALSSETPASRVKT